MLPCVIYGAGPAGLAAHAALNECGYEAALVEAGSQVRERDRHDPRDILRGVGGAGLYSDGKFSFFPSASKLWQLHDKSALREAYDWFRRAVYPLIDPPEWPDNIEADSASGGFMEKRYLSLMAPFEKRLELVERLARQAGGLSTRSEVQAVTAGPSGLEVGTSAGFGPNVVEARCLIAAGGRFGPILSPSLSGLCPPTFRRYEFGVRISQPAEQFVLADRKSADPKLIWSDDAREWRTFCTIRGGEIIQTEADGIVTYSGRGDAASTKFSNVGFNLRLVEPPAGELANECEAVIAGDVRSFNLGWEEYVHLGHEALGKNLDAALRQGLARLEELGDLSSAVIVGPTIEGVGWYPDTDGNLRVRSSNPIWVAGDHTGKFRGLTAALVSGYYCGLMAADYLRGDSVGDGAVD